MTFSNMIPLGYFIVRNSGAVSKPSWASPDYVTVAGCLCEAVMPGLESTFFDEEEITRKWGVSPGEARRLFDTLQDGCSSINYELFHCFTDAEVAACICGKFFAGRKDVLVIGLCTDDVHFLEQPKVRSTSPLPEGAELLGWDLYEYGDYVKENEPLPPLKYRQQGEGVGVLGLGCTFCCCDMDGGLPKRLCVQLNANGMYFDAQSAKKAAKLVNEERLGEPCHYLPFALFKCVC